MIKINLMREVKRILQISRGLIL